jgi:probable DNA repair protein
VAGGLIAMAAAKPFQPKTPASTIQILGVLEAAGLCFDQLWVTGLDDTNWPSQPKPNPFIPKQLQRELNMPHASAERELIYCQNMTHQFQCSAKRVIFSYARTQDDNFTQPSPLIRGLPDLPEIVSTPALSEMIFQHRELEQIIDEQAPEQLEAEQAKGGVRIIENQALCPFKAFAESRLGARELESPLPGLRGKERGTIAHHILERCWKHLQTQEALLSISDHDLHALLDVSIDEALREHAHAQLQQKSYLALEKQRLRKLILDWLQIEKLRSPFTVISSETSTDIQLNKLNINVRIDRIDELQDGKKLIIDYKTGSNVSRSGWYGERPEAPQLPLYAQIDSMQTAGITYAHVAAGKLGFVGVSQYDLEIRGITPSTDLPSAENKDWKQLTEEWHLNLHQLADDFYQGKAEVDPKDPKKTCEHCKLKPLCRIYEYNGYLEDE